MGALDAPGFSPTKARLLSLLNRMTPAGGNPFGTLAPSADIPTVTASTSATVSGLLFGVQSGQVTEVGSKGFWNSTFLRWTVSGQGVTPGVDFFLTGTTIEFEVVFTGGGSCPFWIFVNDRPVAAAPDIATLTSSGSGSTQFLKLVFPDATRRRVEVYIGGGAALAAWRTIRVSLTTLVTPAPKRPLVAFVGDSFFAGSTGASPALQASPFIMSRILGVEALNVSAGGSGYTVTGGFTTYGASSRVGLVQAANAELVVFSGSANDDAQSGVQAAATACYLAYAVALPKAKHIVFGPQPTSATNTVSANRAARIGEVAAAVAASPSVLAYHDMVGSQAGLPAAYSSATTYNDGDRVVYQGSIYQVATPGGPAFANSAPGVTARWALRTFVYSGTGNTGGTTGDGTRDLFLYSDSVHPTVEGSAALAIRQASLIRADLTAAAL